MINWMIGVILALLILFGIIAIIMAKKGKKRPTDYYNLFFMGVIWLPFGVLMWFMNKESSLGTIFSIIGFLYIIIGLAHKKEWKKNHKSWKKLSNKEKKMKRIIIIILTLLLLIGVVVFYYMKGGVV